jgi:hypothetical protein
MNNMMEIKPPAPISTRKNIPSVFLAGSIEMGIAEDWQSKIVKTFENSDVTFFNPRRGEWDASWEQKIESAPFYQQVNWEMNALDKADFIIMYFVPDTKSPISLLELGLYANSGKIVVCCPEGFWRKGNVEAVCEKYDIRMLDSLDDVIQYIDSTILNDSRKKGL